MFTGKTGTESHERVTQALVRYFEGQGWTVTEAACEGYPQPQRVGRHEPDVVASNAQRVIVFGEAKTGNGDIGTQHSREQYHDFSSRVMTGTTTPCPLYLCVPTAYKPEMERVLAEEGLARKENIHILAYG